MKQTKILAVIAAKKKSNRLRNKNLKKFCGKTLLDWALITARKTKIKDIVVTSDSNKILSISKKHYKIILRQRPKNFVMI